MATSNQITSFSASSALSDGIYIPVAQMVSGIVTSSSLTTELSIKSTESIYGTYLGNIGTPNGLSSQLWDSSNSSSAGLFGMGWFNSTGIGTSLGSVVSASDSVLISTPGAGFSSVGGTAAISNAVYIGEGAGHRAANLTIDASIAIGYQARVDASNQLVFGGNASRIYDVYFGPTIGTAAATATTIQPGGGSGTNKQGVNLQIAAGKGTGNSTTDGDIVFLTPDATGSGTTLQSLTEKFRIDRSGSLVAPTTITAVGTTGNQTINKPTGRVNIAAAGTTITVTNNLVTANSIIMAVAATNDATARVTSVVPGAGSFTINTVATTAETAFNFIVLS